MSATLTEAITNLTTATTTAEANTSTAVAGLQAQIAALQAQIAGGGATTDQLAQLDALTTRIAAIGAPANPTPAPTQPAT